MSISVPAADRSVSPAAGPKRGVSVPKTAAQNVEVGERRGHRLAQIVTHGGDEAGLLAVGFFGDRLSFIRSLLRPLRFSPLIEELPFPPFDQA